MSGPYSVIDPTSSILPLQGRIYPVGSLDRTVLPYTCSTGPPRRGEETAYVMCSASNSFSGNWNPGRIDPPSSD